MRIYHTSKTASCEAVCLSYDATAFDGFFGRYDDDVFTAVVVLCARAKEHALAFDTAKFCGFEVEHHHDTLAHHFFGRIVFCNTAYYGAHFTAYLHGEFEEFVRLFHFFRRQNLADSKLDFCKIINGYLLDINDVFLLFVLFFGCFFLVFNLFFLLLWLFLFFLDFYETFFDKFLTHLCHVYSCKDVRGIFFHFSAVCKQTEFVEVVILSNSRTALLNDFLDVDGING